MFASQKGGDFCYSSVQAVVLTFDRCWLRGMDSFFLLWLFFAICKNLHTVVLLCYAVFSCVYLRLKVSFRISKVWRIFFCLFHATLRGKNWVSFDELSLVFAHARGVGPPFRNYGAASVSVLRSLASVNILHGITFHRRLLQDHIEPLKPGVHSSNECVLHSRFQDVLRCVTRARFLVTQYAACPPVPWARLQNDLILPKMTTSPGPCLCFIGVLTSVYNPALPVAVCRRSALLRNWGTNIPTWHHPRGVGGVLCPVLLSMHFTLAAWIKLSGMNCPPSVSAPLTPPPPLNNMAIIVFVAVGGGVFCHLLE